MKLQILYNFVLVKPLEEDTGGIVTPDSDKKIKRGKVVKVAPEIIEAFGLVPSYINEGDIVLYPSFSEQPVRIEGEAYIMVRINELYGVER